LSPIIISWVRPNGYGYILTIGRDLGLETFIIHFTKRQEARRGRRRELVEGKNLRAKLKPRI